MEGVRKLALFDQYLTLFWKLQDTAVVTMQEEDE